VIKLYYYDLLEIEKRPVDINVFVEKTTPLYHGHNFKYQNNYESLVMM